MSVYEEYLAQSHFNEDNAEHYDAYTETSDIDSHTEYSDTHQDA